MATKKTHKKESGVTLLECMIAISMLMIMAAGLAGAFGFCTGMNKTQGEIATRTVELAQDKMEQLLALSFTDTLSNTTVYPTVIGSGGTGLGNMTVSATAGSTVKGAAVAGYVDYIDTNGNLATAATGVFTRQWSITNNATGPNLKTITVAVYASSTEGGSGVAPSSVIVSMKTYNQ